MKAAIYTRVSTEEQAREGYSISAQQRACLEYCRQREWEVVKEYIDEGRSAHSDSLSKRPDFRALMEAVAEKQVDVVVVHKFDRFSRSMAVTVDAFKVFSQAGCGFVSITEQFDYTTPQGRLFLHMLAALADFYSQALSTETHKGKAERKAQGLYNGALPYGLRKGDDKLPEPDPEHWPRLVAMFELAADGLSDADIAAELNSRGWRMTGRLGTNLWRKDTVRRILTNRFYLGELPLIDYPKHRKKGLRMGWKEGKHVAFLDTELFARAESARAEHRRTAAGRCVPKSSHTYPLSGLLRCGYCEEAGEVGLSHMRIADDRGHLYVRCYRRTQGLGCQQPTVTLGAIEEQVERWLERINVPQEAVIHLLKEMERAEPPEAGELEQRRVKHQLERLRLLWLWGDIDESAYLVQRNELQTRLRAMQPFEKRKQNLLSLAAWLCNVPAVYAAGTWAQKHEVLLSLIDKVVIKDRAVSVHPRPELQKLLPQ